MSMVLGSIPETAKKKKRDSTFLNSQDGDMLVRTKTFPNSLKSQEKGSEYRGRVLFCL
jgi:hypothetical protein